MIKTDSYRGGLNMKKHLILLGCLLGFLGTYAPAEPIDGYPKAVIAEITGATW
jgi:hypothetical protein